MTIKSKTETEGQKTKVNCLETLDGLKEIIDEALKSFQRTLNSRKSLAIMSEGDFEWRLAKCIEDKIKKTCKTDQGKNELLKYTVHTQVSYLKDKNKIELCKEEVKDKNKRIDIVLLDMDKFIELDSKEKGMKYTGCSFALELKFIRPGQSIGASNIADDFKKRNSIENNSWLYIVPLIDDSKGEYDAKVKDIETILDKYKKYKDKTLYFKPMIIHKKQKEMKKNNKK